MVPQRWIMEMDGVFLTEDDVEILTGSINRRVRFDPVKDQKVHKLFRRYMGIEEVVYH
jgi:hypothetical protein